MDNISYEDKLKQYLQERMNRDYTQDIEGLKQAQQESASRQAQAGMLEAAAEIGQAGIKARDVGVNLQGSRDAAKAQLDNYLKQKITERNAQQDQIGAAKILADMENDKAKAEREEKRWKRMEAIAAAKPKPQTEFEKTLEKEQAKNFATLQDKQQVAVSNEDAVNNAYKAFDQYSSKKIGGTGPLATLGGLTTYVSQDTEKLDTMFKDLALTKMVNMFQGMSKAVDSNAERAAFQATTPSITLDDATNRERLLGLKAISARNKVEAEAQKRWVGQYGNLDRYESPNKYLTPITTSTGDVTLLPKGQEIPEGYMKLDDLVNTFKKSGGKSSKAKSYEDMSEEELDAEIARRNQK